MADVFAGLLVSDIVAARAWYERLFGKPPSLDPHDTESVWQLEEHAFVYVNEDTERAGRSVMTVFTEEIDAVIDEIAKRGIEPANRETYANGVRKVTIRDADGNEIGFGGPPEGV